jgi:hypothetical protein
MSPETILERIDLKLPGGREAVVKVADVSEPNGEVVGYRFDVMCRGEPLFTGQCRPTFSEAYDDFYDWIQQRLLESPRKQKAKTKRHKPEPRGLF